MTSRVGEGKHVHGVPARRALTRGDILQSVWGYDVFVTSRSVDRCVNTLRKKVELDPARPVFIRTVREIGYRFEE